MIDLNPYANAPEYPELVQAASHMSKAIREAGSAGASLSYLESLRAIHDEIVDVLLHIEREATLQKEKVNTE